MFFNDLHPLPLPSHGDLAGVAQWLVRGVPSYRGVQEELAEDAMRAAIGIPDRRLCARLRVIQTAIFHMQYAINTESAR